MLVLIEVKDNAKLRAQKFYQEYQLFDKLWYYQYSQLRSQLPGLLETRAYLILKMRLTTVLTKI